MENANIEKSIDEVKAPVNQDMVEAAKQILVDALEKAVDTIKESNLSGDVIEQKPIEKNLSFKYGEIFVYDDQVYDYILIYGKTNIQLIAEDGSFTKDIGKAMSFNSYDSAMKYARETFDKSYIEEMDVLMRTIKYRLNEIGHGE